MSRARVDNEAPYNAKLGHWLKQLRMNKKLSQAELGEEVRVHRNAISRYERGGGMPLFVFLQICEKLDVHPAEVLKW